MASGSRNGISGLSYGADMQDLTACQKSAKLFFALGSEDPLKPETFAKSAVEALKEEAMSTPHRCPPLILLKSAC